MDKSDCAEGVCGTVQNAKLFCSRGAVQLIMLTLHEWDTTASERHMDGVHWTLCSERASKAMMGQGVDQSWTHGHS